MTHEELLAKMAEHIDYRTCGVCDGKCYKEENIPWLALRVVVELHKPTEVVKGYPYGPYCTHEVNWEWPCPTIQAIEKELA